MPETLGSVLPDAEMYSRFNDQKTKEELRKAQMDCTRADGGACVGLAVAATVGSIQPTIQGTTQLTCS